MEAIVPERNLLEQSALGGSRASRKEKVHLRLEGGDLPRLRAPKGSLRRP